MSLFDLVQLVTDIVVGRRLVEVAGDVEERLGERGPNVLIEGGVFEEFRDRLLHLFAKLVVGHGRAGTADDGKAGRNTALVKKTIERGQQLSLREIAAGSEDDDGAGGD